MKGKLTQPTKVEVRPTNTKIMAVFFPMKPLKNKFSDNFIASQLSEFIPKLSKYSNKIILYKIDKERFYTYDFKTETFDDKFEVVDNQTIVAIFSVDKSENVDISEYFEEDFFKSVNTIRIHRKRVDRYLPGEPKTGKVLHDGSIQKPSYIFYTINSTRLLNKIISIIQEPEPHERNQSKTFFILSANSARRNIDPIEKSFSTEKICRMNYISTIDLSEKQDESFLKSLKRKLSFQIKF